MAAGIKVFASLEEAAAAGFRLYEKRPDGFLVRRDDGHAYALALVRAKAEDQKKAPGEETPS